MGWDPTKEDVQLVGKLPAHYTAERKQIVQQCPPPKSDPDADDAAEPTCHMRLSLPAPLMMLMALSPEALKCMHSGARSLGRAGSLSPSSPSLPHTDGKPSAKDVE